MLPQNDTPPARPMLPMLVTPAEKWLVKFTLWLAIFCTIIAVWLLQNRVLAANIASILSIALFTISVLGVALRVIWRFCPGWTRWLSSAALFSCVLGLCNFFVLPLFPFVSSPSAAFMSDVLAGVGAMLVVLSAFFTFTALEDRHAVDR